MSELKRKRSRRMIGLMTLGIVCGLVGVWMIGGSLCARVPGIITTPTDLPVEPVVISSDSEATLNGWLIAGTTNKGVVVLMHGVRGCRMDMLNRARFLAAAGYTVLLFDFQAHGESTGKHITFGYLEGRDAWAVIQFVKKRFPSKPIGVIGGSLGGASALLASPPLDAQALVLESVYPTIEDALKDRLEIKLGRPGRWLAPLLTCQLKLRLGISVDDLCPIRCAATNKIPKLLIAGTLDRHTKIEEAREMFRQAAEPKELWEVEGAAHVGFHDFDQEAYEKRVLAFFSKHLHEN